MRIVSYYKEKKLLPKIMEQESIYNNSNTKITMYQIEKFNQLWKDIQRNVPYYKNLVKNEKLPTEIKTWDDFSLLPIQNRPLIRGNIDMFTNNRNKPDYWATTGGSTGTPLKFPKWNSEILYTEPVHWLGRRFYNVKRSDKLFLLWGHSHLLGTGIKKYKNLIIRKLKDKLLGYYRFSAYDLSESKLQDAGKRILKFKPQYIIGYSKALYLLAKANEYRKKEFHSLNLKCVIGAAEGFDSIEDKNFVEEVFGCPVALEYGSIETTVMAYTHPQGGYKVFWANNILEGIPTENGKDKLLITSLYHKAFPLIRYDIGDIVTDAVKDENSIVSFQDIFGRDNDFVILEDGTTLHGGLFNHAIRTEKKVISFQVHQLKNSELVIYLKCSSPLSNAEIDGILIRLSKIDNRLSSCEIKQVKQLKQTVAGKTKWLIRE